MTCTAMSGVRRRLLCAELQKCADRRLRGHQAQLRSAHRPRWLLGQPGERPALGISSADRRRPGLQPRLPRGARSRCIGTKIGEPRTAYSYRNLHRQLCGRRRDCGHHVRDDQCRYLEMPASLLGCVAAFASNFVACSTERQSTEQVLNLDTSRDMR